ncbi:hypothetical protein J31TS3_29480 [Paenibacillus lactis]|nr:hypothetical protein J31TS3_29480 [Paenibacillus lactis]
MYTPLSIGHNSEISFSWIRNPIPPLFHYDKHRFCLKKITCGNVMLQGEDTS